MKWFQKTKKQGNAIIVSGGLTLALVVIMLFAFMYLRVGESLLKRVPVRIGNVIIQAEVVKTEAAKRQGLSGIRYKNVMLFRIGFTGFHQASLVLVQWMKRGEWS